MTNEEKKRKQINREIISEWDFLNLLLRIKGLLRDNVNYEI
jgi:hypothetical protein